MKCNYDLSRNCKEGQTNLIFSGFHVFVEWFSCIKVPLAVELDLLQILAWPESFSFKNKNKNKTKTKYLFAMNEIVV